ncbi:MAG TPA: LysM domain-containing protein [Trichocoleus sp.]
MFPRTSRYAQNETAQLTTTDGRQIVYLRRRFLPKTVPPTQAEHTVVEGDRLDNITAQYLGDPEQFWRICDANRAMHPD